MKKYRQGHFLASASSSTADPEIAGGVYEVFLSFCGIDTRKGFTDFLYMDLIGAGIRTFKDDNELRVGEEISLELLKSIRESKISIPIFSKNYASSKWCLRELEQMIECHNNGSQMIYPLFYDVDPSDVQNQRGSYGKAFGQHKKKFSKQVVQRWRDALKMVGGLKGLELIKETNGHQGEFVKLVVADVLMKLEKKYKHVPENLVGMDFHIQELMGLLEVDSGDVRIIGIHGMGGLGKTTMATLIYNNLYDRFEGHCFLDNIRENSKDMVELQKQLISKILDRKVDESFSNVNQGRRRIKDVVLQKKLLIVLDDVDNISQVTDLMGHQSWFGLQSRIIFTTRYKDVLDIIEFKCQNEDPCVVYKSYNPKFMNNSDSLRLFSKHAFKKESPLNGYDILSMGVVSIAAGLPLVLVVLGSTFYTIRDKDIWEDKLRQLKNTPNKDVMDTLKFSFEALENAEKQIFLDIACLFIGYNKARPCYMWESCGFHPRTAISVLVSRSLITLNDCDELRMHDQLRDLGRQIVREEGLRNNNPAEQSRLWCSETQQATSRVNALCLVNRVKVAATYFHNSLNLKYLNMMCVDCVDGDFKNLLPNLRWFQCSTKKFSTSNLTMKNLVILELSCVNLADDWNGWNELKEAYNLKVLDLSDCKSLQTLPNLSNLRKLVELKLSFCVKLIEIQGLEKLEYLKILDAKGCWSLIMIRKLQGLKCLEHLDLGDCYNLEGLGDLSNLNKLKLLKVRKLDNTTDFSHFKMLREMVISYSNIIEIQGIATLESLQVLSISFCNHLERLSELPNFGILNKISIFGCDKLQEVDRLGVIKSLERLSISNCYKLQKLPNLQNLEKLKKMTLSFLELNEIHGLEQLKSLVELEILYCDHLSEIPDLRNLQKLRILKIQHLKNSTEISGLEELKSLQSLSITDCNWIEVLPDLSALQKLKELHVRGCAKLYRIRGIQKLKRLTKLDISGCEGLEFLPDLPNVDILRGPNPWNSTGSVCPICSPCSKPLTLQRQRLLHGDGAMFIGSVIGFDSSTPASNQLWHPSSEVPTIKSLLPP